jgi:hypothetical protein
MLKTVPERAPLDDFKMHAEQGILRLPNNQQEKLKG